MWWLLLYGWLVCIALLLILGFLKARSGRGREYVIGPHLHFEERLPGGAHRARRDDNREAP